MSLPRALSQRICRALIGVLLLAQFAVASYACPGLSAMPAMGSDAAMSATSTEMAPGCDQVDPDAANLCAEHCRHGQQSANTAPTPAVAAPVPALLYLLPLEPEPLLSSTRMFPASDPVLATPPPPHAILHCVYRI